MFEDRRDAPPQGSPPSLENASDSKLPKASPTTISGPKNQVNPGSKCLLSIDENQSEPSAVTKPANEHSRRSLIISGLDAGARIGLVLGPVFGFAALLGTSSAGVRVWHLQNPLSVGIAMFIIPICIGGLVGAVSKIGKNNPR